MTEAAAVDGAKPYQAFRAVVFPLLLVAVAPLLIASFAFNFNNFNVIQLTTGRRAVPAGQLEGRRHGPAGELHLPARVHRGRRPVRVRRRGLRPDLRDRRRCSRSSGSGAPPPSRRSTDDRSELVRRRRLAPPRGDRRDHLRADPDPVRRLGGVQPAGHAELDRPDPEPVRHSRTSRTCSRRTDFAWWFLNSILIAGCATFFSLALATFAAFAFSRYRFNGRRPGLLFLLIVQMFPAFLAIVDDLHHVHQDHGPVPDHRLQHPLEPVLLYLGGALGREHVADQGLLRHRAQGARRVGQGRRRVAHHDVLPRSSCRWSSPSSWWSGCSGSSRAINEFLMASVFLTQGESKTLAVGLYGLIAGERNANFGMFAAGTLLTAIPTVVLFYAAPALHRRRPHLRCGQGLTDRLMADAPGNAPRLGPPRRLGPVRAAGRDHRPRPAAARRRGPAPGARGPRRAGRPAVPAHGARRRAGARRAGRGRPGPACRWFEVTTRLTMPVTDYRFLVVGSGRAPGGSTGAASAGAHRDRPRRLPARRRVRPAGVARRTACSTRSFPDRFENGDPANDVRRRRLGLSRAAGAGGAPGSDRPSGRRGRVRRVLRRRPAPASRARLDHLVDLGVNAIYLNPVFDARSNHGYDTIDYGHVAAHFGGDEALVSLRRATRARDIRADPRHRPQPHRRRAPLVPRRAGRPVRADRRLLHVPRAARRLRVVARRASRCPSSTTAIARAARRDVRGPTTPILRRWLRAAVLGRTAGGSTWPTCSAARARSSSGRRSPAGMRAAVKDANPDAYLMGEHFYDATDALNGDQWDGVMNYAGFTNPVLEWLSGVEHRSAGFGTVVARRTADRPTSWSRRSRRSGPRCRGPSARCQYDLLGSHDTPRVRSRRSATRVGCGPRSGCCSATSGCPGVLYGDEVGLAGRGRATRAALAMPWDEEAWDLDHLEFVRDAGRVPRRGPGRSRRAASRSSRPAPTGWPSCATRTTSR